MSRIRRVSLSEQVLESIIQYVRDNDLHAGDRLPTEGEFADLFQVSRTIVREAIKGLSINGAVRSIPGKGTFLGDSISDVIFSRDTGTSRIVAAQSSIRDIMEMRTALEILSFDLAIERWSEEGVLVVQEAMDELRQTVNDGKPWNLAGTKFHLAIAQMSGNSLLLKSIDSLASVIGRYKQALFNAETRMDHHLQDHQNILNALMQRDRDLGEQAVRIHMRNTENDIRKLVNTRNANFFVHD